MSDFFVFILDFRDRGYRLQEIVDHFLMKDELNRQESMRRARLRAQAKIDAEVKLQRRAYKDKWGIALDYAYRYEIGTAKTHS